ncbi:unnamed protein product, partial [marine sediment metagenome]
SKKLRKRIEGYLKGEVETYDNYLTGYVFGYCIKDADGEDVDSCWGFYGDPEKSSLKEYVDDFIKNAA